jgi:hypothetical protein
MTVESMNVLKAIKKGLVDVKAIRLFPTKPLLFIESRRATSEKPALLVKSIDNKKRACKEVELVFLGDYHVADPDARPHVKPYKDWLSFGLIVLSIDQARELIMVLERVTEV